MLGCGVGDGSEAASATVGDGGDAGGGRLTMVSCASVCDSNVLGGESIDGDVLLQERSFMCLCMSSGCYVCWLSCAFDNCLAYKIAGF